MAHSPELLEQTFDLFVAAAIAGERCPSNVPYGPLKSAAGLALARQGRIRIEISNKNWRTVTILTGPHAGQHTQRDPGGAKPWKIIGAETVVHGRTKDYGASGRTQPSAPRALTSVDLKHR